MHLFFYVFLKKKYLIISEQPKSKTNLGNLNLRTDNGHGVALNNAKDRMFSQQVTKCK